MFEGIQFSSFSEFINMGGHAFNVWSVYALFTIFLIANILFPILKRKRIIREQKRRLSMQEEYGSTSENLSNLDATGGEIS